MSRTAKDNAQDMVKKGRHNPHGKKNHIFTKRDILIIRRMKKLFNTSHWKLAAYFKVHPTTIGKILRRERWKNMCH